MPVLNEYSYLVPFGGAVYGVHNSKSDEDYYMIQHETRKQFEGLYSQVKNDDGDDIHYITKEEFQRKLDAHDITCMEIYFHNKKSNDMFSNEFEFNYDSDKLRRTISGVCSNSWVKAKKKMLKGDDYIGRKSMWHSIRILMFGVQIAKHQKIVDFTEANKYYNEIVLSDTPYWVMHNKFKPIMNELQIEFRKMAPKVV